jgi:outer membrane protein OmpA-like peptidoglycan-associated protein
MSKLIRKTAIAVGVAFTFSLSAHAVDDLTVNGYAKSSSGEPVTSGSGDCVRTGYKDTQELLEACGYKKVVKEQVAVQQEPAGVGVAVVEETAVVRGGEVLAAKEEIVAEAFVQNLQFEFGSADLTTADKAELDGVIANLAPHRPLLRDNIAYLNVVGHTDSVGPEAFNQTLSERRAQSVADYLADEGGVRREVMRVSGRGEAEPMADNNTDEGRRLNRRVVIEVIKQ